MAWFYLALTVYFIALAAWHPEHGWEEIAMQSSLAAMCAIRCGMEVQKWLMTPKEPTDAG